jgi:hypothetical protein
MNCIDNICKHKWIKDYIDINDEKSEKIIYCDNCKITKLNFI